MTGRRYSRTEQAVDAPFTANHEKFIREFCSPMPTQKQRFIRGIYVKAVYPLFYLAARSMGVSRERLQRMLISTSNALVRREYAGRAKRVLLLLPHCLQRDECAIRVTSNIYNCARCGECEITELIDLAEEFNLELHVATGGTLARRIVVETRPEAIVAVACERDLSSGIGDSYPLPVLGVLNERPHGPCINTAVDLDKIREALYFFTNGNSSPHRPAAGGG